MNLNTREWRKGCDSAFFPLSYFLLFDRNVSLVWVQGKMRFISLGGVQKTRLNEIGRIKCVAWQSIGWPRVQAFRQIASAACEFLRPQEGENTFLSNSCIVLKTRSSSRIEKSSIRGCISQRVTLCIYGEGTHKSRNVSLNTIFFVWKKVIFIVSWIDIDFHQFHIMIKGK